MLDLKPVHKLRSIFREIPCRFFLVLDNLDDLLASKPNDSATSSVKQEVVDLIQEILVSCQNVSFLTTTRESLEFMRLKVVGYESLRIVPLDQRSSRKLISKLLPSPAEDVILVVIKIAGSVPLAIKLVCSLLSENIRTPKEVLDDLTSSPNLLEMLDNPDYPNDLRLKKLIDSSFDRLSLSEKEAFISLSVFLGADINCDAAVAVIGGNKTVAWRTLNILTRKSLIDQDSDSKIFSLHQLIQSFAFGKGERDLQEVAFSSRTRFCNYYLFLFEDLNEQYLTGSSLRAYMACLQEKENICLSLIESFSHEGLREKVFDVLTKAELLIKFTLRTNNDDQIDHVYELAIETAKQVKNDSALCKIVVSHFFRTTLLDEVSLIPEGLKKSISLMRDGTAAKLLCYEGIRAICRGETERGAVLLTEGYSSLEKNPDQQILKCISLQLLSVYYAHSNNPDRSTQFRQMALDQCKEFGVSRLFLIGEYETSTVKARDETLGTALPSQPLIFEILFLISVWARNILSDEMKHALSNTVCEMQREIQLQGSNELYSILEAGDAALSFLSTGQQTRLDETIQSIKTELEKEEAIMQGSDNANKSEKTMRQKLLEERLANCYRYKGYHHSIKNEQDLLLESLQRSLHVTLNLYGENHRDSAACYFDIGALQHKMGEHTSALESLKHALDIWLKVYGEQHSHTAECYLEMGNTHFDMGNYTLALEEQQHSLEIRLKLHGEQHLTTAAGYFFIGKTQCYMGDYKSSLEFHERALEIRLNLHDEQHVTTASSLLNIGITQFFMKEYKEALNSNYRALKISLNLHGELHEFTGNCYRNTGIVWRAIRNKKISFTEL